MAKQIGFWAGLALAGLMALPALAEDLTADTVVATVNGTNITLGNIIVMRDSLPDQYKAMPDDVLFKGILEQMIQQVALEQALGDSLTRKDTIAIENTRRAYLSNVALDPVVKAAVTDEALQKAYDAKFAGATPALEYHASHLLVDSEEKANDLKKQIEGGAAFAEVAKANSTDGSAQTGGDLGWFGLGAMVKPFEDAVVAAEVGKVTGPIKTDFGWHLILVTETRQKANPTLDEIRDQLAAEVEKSAVEAYVKGLTDKATITRPGEGIDPAVIKDLTLLDK